MTKLDELEKLSKAAYLDYAKVWYEDLDALIKVARAADKFIDRYCEVFELDKAHEGELINNFKEALAELERGHD